jgi:hypothetical protein
MSMKFAEFNIDTCGRHRYVHANSKPSVTQCKDVYSVYKSTLWITRSILSDRSGELETSETPPLAQFLVELRRQL